MSKIFSGCGSRLDVAATVAQRKCAVSRVRFAVRQHHLLKLLNRFGWCTTEMVQQIAAQVGMKAPARRSYLSLSQKWEVARFGATLPQTVPAIGGR